MARTTHGSMTPLTVSGARVTIHTVVRSLNQPVLILGDERNRAEAPSAFAVKTGIVELSVKQAAASAA
jgi:hypothetical protein